MQLKDGWDYCSYVIGFIITLLLGIISICCAVECHEQEVENKNTEEKYNICVDAGYSVYMDGQKIDGSKIVFEADEYKVKFDDSNKEIILQEKQ